jgi:hypothetical protein
MRRRRPEGVTRVVMWAAVVVLVVVALPVYLYLGGTRDALVG